ncbi:MAG: type IV secretory system conjugative DNA transfer family protein [Bifidobacterium longum]|nr:type IV secretory system conjugative DNA transfer family protein [Bifidobacterium longum]
MKRLQAILPAATGLFTLFWLGDKIGYQIRTDLDKGMSVIDLMNRFWLDLYHPFHLSTNHIDLLCGLTAMGIGLLIWAYKYTARLNLRSGEEHGSAHWGTPKDIRPFIDPVESHNIRFTATERLSIDTRLTLRNLNTLLLGSSGSGKTRYYVKPNLLSVDMNWAVTDPKGELKRDTEHAMRNHGYQVNTLDLIHLDRMGASEQDEDREYIIDALFAETQTEIHRMREHPDDYDKETQAMLDGLAFACAQYNTFLKGAGETKKSIIITTGVHLAPLQVREVRRILDGDDIRLETLDQGKRVVYLELPDTNATFSFIASVFYQCLFETLVRKADANPDGILDRDVHCMLDEFANIGKIPNFVRLIATIRSRRISCSIILQTVSQGKSLYKDDWETIAGNCDSQLFLGGNEPSTTKYISDRLGDQTIDVIETSETKGLNGSWTRSTRKNARKLLTPDELGRIPSDRCIYLLRGIPPFFSQRR